MPGYACRRGIIERMSEALRLIGLMQDGALLPVLPACAVVWMTMTVRQLRGDVASLRDEHRKTDASLRRVAEDVAFLRGRAERQPTP